MQMVQYLFNRAEAAGWIPLDSLRSPQDCSGVLMRRSRGNYITAPHPVNHVLLGAVIRLNLNAAITMRPKMLDGILASLTPGQTEVKFKDGSQIQVLDSLTFAQPANVKKFQYACFFRQERLILVWHDDLVNIVPQATSIEEKLLALVSINRAMNFSIGAIQP